MRLQAQSPLSTEDWRDYYELRYQVLRAPLGQPPGSERDALEADSAHRLVRGSDGTVLAVGRLHRLADGWCQVRYMAVAEKARGQGLGAVVLQALEQQALTWGCVGITLNAREQAVGFYQHLGYQSGRELEPLYGVPHQQMTKQLRLGGDAHLWLQWCSELQKTWHQTIPLSAFMQLQIDQFDGASLCCSAPLAPNKNLHQTMFAGSIYSLLTLTGWGLVWLQLRDAGLAGDIVLADAQMKYQLPVKGPAQAIATLQQTQGSLAALAERKKVRQKLTIQLRNGDQLLAELQARFAVLPLQGSSADD